jgi:hypothetical protein
MQFEKPAHVQSAFTLDRGSGSLHVDYLPTLRKDISELNFERISMYQHHALRYLRKVPHFLRASTAITTNMISTNEPDYLIEDTIAVLTLPALAV